MKKNIYIILSVIIFLISCSPVKNIKKNNQNKIKSISTKRLIKQVKNNYLKYNTLSFKASTKINFNKKRFPLKINFRIKHDSIIWIYIAHSSGYPVANLVLTKDSVKLINKIQKNYFLGDYRYFYKNFNIKLNYNNIQSLLTNEFFVFADTINIKKIKTKLKIKPDTGFYMFSTLKKHKLHKRLRKQSKNKLKYTLINQTFIINALTKKISKIIIENITENQKISINYNTFVTKNDQLIPKNILMQYNNNNDSSIIKLKIKLSKFNFDKKLKYKFKIPKSYKNINE